MKRFFLILTLLACLAGYSGIITARNDTLSWQDINLPNSILGYHVALSISGSNSAISAIQINGQSNTQLVLTNLISTNRPVGEYDIFVRGIGTNGLFSIWSTNLPITLIINTNYYRPFNLNIIKDTVLP